MGQHQSSEGQEVLALERFLSHSVNYRKALKELEWEMRVGNTLSMKDGN